MGIRHRIRMSRASICLIVAGALIAQAGVALFAVAAVGAQTLPGSVTPAKANAATGYDYVNLGDNFESESLNNSDVVAGNINNDLDQLGVWKNGITTPLKTAPLPAGSSGGASANAVLANGAVIGGEANSQTAANAAEWDPPYSAAPTRWHDGTQSTFATAANAAGKVGYLVGTFNAGGSPQLIPHGAVSNAGGKKFRDITTVAKIKAMSATTYLASGTGQGGSAGSWVGSIASGNPTALGFNALSMASDGTIVGNANGSSQGVERAPNGIETNIAAHVPLLVSADGTVVAEDGIWLPGASAGIPLANLLPASYIDALPVAINDNGDLTGYSYDNSEALHGWLLERVSTKLNVTPSITSSKSSVATGASVPYTVTVSAPASNTSDVSDLAWGSATPGGFGVTPSAAATLSTALTPTLPSSLSPGQSVVLSGTVKAGKQSVTATLSATVVGQDGQGGAVSGTGDKQVVIGVKPLTLSVVTTPGEVHLDVDNDGKVTPKTVTVKVTFTNHTKKTMSGVKLIALQPAPQDRSQQLDKIGFPSSVIPAKVPDIPAGKAVARKFTLKVTGDGKYVIRATAIYPDANAKGGNGRASVQGGTFESVVPIYFFRSHIDASDTSSRGGSRWVKGGDKWLVKGTLKNLSSYQSLCLPPMVASTKGNADALGMQDIATSDVTSDDPPIVGLIKPGASYSLSMLVVTSSVGSTRGELTLPTAAFKSVPGSSCEVQADGSMSGAGARLTTVQTHIVGGSTDFTVHVDVSVNDDTTYFSNAIAFFGGYAKGTILGFAGFAHGLLATLKQCANSIPEYQDQMLAMTGNPVAASNLLARVNARIQAMTALAANYLETATPQEKEQLGTQVKSAFRRAGNDAYNNVAAKYDAISNAWFGDIIAAQKTGNADDEWRVWGEASGDFSTSVVLQVLVAVLGKQMAAEIPQMEARAAAATGEGGELTTLKGGVVVAGRGVTLADAERAGGLTAQQDSALGRIAKKFNILIGVRARQAISILLEKRGAVWKNSNFHQKTINPLDVDYMDFPKADKGLLGWRSFTPAGKAAAERKIIFGEKNLTTAQRSETFGRLDGRIGENGPDLTKVNRMLNTERNGVKGWTNAGFNATESGRATSSVRRWRRFAVVETEITDENGVKLGTYSKPYQESIDFSPGSAIPALCSRSIIVGIVMCPITGDLDLSYITTLYGNGLSSALMLDVFADLEKEGFAHTDLVTWVEQQTGAAMFPGKIKQLKDIAVGGEAVIQIAPDPIRRATYLDLTKSIITGPNNYQLAIRGTFVPEMK